MYKQILIILLLLVCPHSLSAQNISLMDLLQRGDNFFQISAGLGGDTFASTTGGDTIAAGDSFLFSFGRDARYANKSKRFLRTSIGYKFGALQANNGNASVSALILKALYMQQSATIVYGLGFTAHISPTLQLPTTNEKESLTLGMTVQLSYRLSASQEMGLYLDTISYDTVSANSTGIMYTKRFGN